MEEVNNDPGHEGFRAHEPIQRVRPQRSRGHRPPLDDVCAESNPGPKRVLTAFPIGHEQTSPPKLGRTEQAPGVRLELTTCGSTVRSDTIPSPGEMREDVP